MRPSLWGVGVRVLWGVGVRVLMRQVGLWFLLELPQQRKLPDALVRLALRKKPILTNRPWSRARADSVCLRYNPDSESPKPPTTPNMVRRMTIDPEAARPDEWPAAFRLLFRHVSDDERDTRVANVLRLVERGQLNAQGVFVLRSAEGLVGVMVCQALPGAMALVWPPQCSGGVEQIERENRLLHHAAGWLRSRGVKLAQSLFPPDGIVGADSLERNGFVHITHLAYLRHTLVVPPHCLATPERLEFATVEADPERFATTLIRSYEGTLDCPEINDVRTVEEILEGHRSQGIYDAQRWWLGMDASRPVGVLLSVQTAETGEWDVAYVGIVPEARGRGFGRELMLKVLFEARAADVPAVTLSVDGRNHPAQKLYRYLGFETFDRREVYLAIWR